MVPKSNEPSGRDRGPVVDRHAIAELEDATRMGNQLDGAEMGIENPLRAPRPAPPIGDSRRADGPPGGPDGVARTKHQLRRDPGRDIANALPEEVRHGQATLSLEA